MSVTVTALLWIVIGFFCGSIPFSVLIARMKGVDIRKVGSGNPGATNVTRTCGLAYGAAALICDALKGFIPVLISMHYVGSEGYVPSMTALAAVLGHINSPFLGFKGGKGVATTIGVLLALAPMALFFGLIICVAVIALTGYVSAGSLALVASLPVIYWLQGLKGLIPLGIVMLCLVFFTHRGNIGRLMKGEEKSWRKSKNK